MPRKIINIKFGQLNRLKLPQIKFSLREKRFSFPSPLKLESLKESPFYPPLTVLVFGLIVSAITWGVNSLFLPDLPSSLDTPTQVLEPFKEVPREEEVSMGEAQVPGPAAETSSEGQRAGELITEKETALNPPLETAPAQAEVGEEVIEIIEVTPDLKNMIWPVDGPLGQSFGFGYSEIYQDYRLHPGVDILASPHSAVTAALGGVVQRVEALPSGGFLVTLDHGSQWQTCYQPLKTSLKPGDQVEQGEVLGYLDPEFFAPEESYLHFQLRHQGQALDPQEYLK